MVNWMTTLFGLIAAVGAGFLGSNEPSLHMAGLILSIVGTAGLGITAKQFNVHGGTKAQATPPEVEAKVRGPYPGADCSKD